MREGRLIERNVELALSDIQMGTRLRPVSEAGVASLRQSYKNLGVIKDAIQVRRKKAGELVLIAGAHRLTFAQEQGWETIRADIWECTKDWARLMEIDDNLAGADLAPLERVVFLAERKRVHEKIFPETKAGIAGAKARWDATEIFSFAKAAAEVLGCSTKKVEMLVRAGTMLSADQVRWLRGSPKPVKLGDLYALSKIGDDHERSQVCIALSNGAAKSAADAIRQRQTDTPVKDPVEEAFKSLRQAWARAPKAAQRRFVEAEYGDLIGVIGDFEADNADFGAGGDDG